MARILVIEDEEDVRTMIRTALEVDKHEVQETSDAESGMDLFRKQPADLVITDIMLPGKGGLDVIKQLRQDHPDIRIIALSGKGAYDLKRAAALGADITIHKPLSLWEFLDTVKKLLGEDTK